MAKLTRKDGPFGPKKAIRHKEGENDHIEWPNGAISREAKARHLADVLWSCVYSQALDALGDALTEATRKYGVMGFSGRMTLMQWIEDNRTPDDEPEVTVEEFTDIFGGKEEPEGPDAWEEEDHG